jgi:TPR repeat protein
MRVLLIAWMLLASAPVSAAAQDPTMTTEETRGLELALNGDPGDAIEARRLLEIASAAGRAEAMNALAGMVGNGAGGPADVERARALTLRAAELGSIGANLSLSDAHLSGLNGFPRNPERALQYMIAAAEGTTHPRSAAYAQWRVGMMFLNGEGTARDPARAYEWVARAANNGAVQGMLSRAVMLARGEGVAQDASAARQWYLQAAETGGYGSAHALRSLGAMLIVGEGGSIDTARGYAFLLLAQDGGDEFAVELLRRFDSRIDDRVRAEAPAIMTAWRLSHGNPRPDRDPVTGQLN